MPRQFTADQIFPYFPEGFPRTIEPSTKMRYTFREEKHWDGTDRLYIAIETTDDPLDGTGRDIPQELLRK